MRTTAPSVYVHTHITGKKAQLGLECRKWGCDKWGFKGCLASHPGNRPKSAFFALFLPFSPFSGRPEDPHLRHSNWGSKVRAFEGQLLVRSTLPLAFSTLDPFPLSRSPICCLWYFETKEGMQCDLGPKLQGLNSKASTHSCFLCSRKHGLHYTPPRTEIITVVAKPIAELICFEPEVCICNGIH